MIHTRSSKDLSVSRRISEANKPKETIWLLDGEELDLSDDDTDIQPSQQETQPNRGLFTHFDDPRVEDEAPPSPTASQVSFLADPEWREQPVALEDYYSDNVAIAYEREKRTYTCFYLSAAAIVLLVASFGISLWWSVSHDDVSGGFGMGSYMLAVSSVIIAIATYMHRQDCRCWVRENDSLI
ncbi:hypothetical protein F5B19DRAFT_493829 [Rostrohypoxylon terebratum]|nr:hypothetical protein F5B19DRAFT_493829 [Rostrohypoxylon terebratum]